MARIAKDWGQVGEGGEATSTWPNYLAPSPATHPVTTTFVETARGVEVLLSEAKARDA